ncbi:4-hydroxy-tetrahydrodipicolinate synthase [Burkholderia multivorans]|uniref:4-hydroxy-tetrahydrodipicolinate synthase n=1 Tax=Burkholderia multivorans TaxID=87883 RepID=UPI0020188E04|nr:4-hydroxy-tetrahydrodipicolinate synthase [Burkholderia multivorans]MCA8143524.1 4-hydroxy-tetrahydrodipicolinate synthase [Burkholderia multivorans]MCO1368534.1 4-hydroxy-tetrahydrodipicolinate synthase [Burkholderia multivorans]MCO1380425.1 4-hydroxy-tetrahydrodipicolinate synthase [Burkholderia multivorans]UQP21464.1 4-hydroxy-tetrahydrodipicolinate synthase [Burkholderia multivorans]UQP92089.1 4-hydroxy-tetrahydrodipicolinate synthase [Burkholderia multivorans]
MSNHHPYAGILTAVPTPLDAEGKFRPEPLATHIRNLVAAGADGIVPLGGTGESQAIAFEERMRVFETSLECAGSVPVIPGVMAPGLGDAIANAKAFVKAGARALMVVTPYYYRPTQDGILDYYKRISDSVDADIILYEIPYRTGVSLHFETVDKLADMTRVVGIKACNPDLATQMRAAELAKDKMAILSGEEDVLPLHVAMGAVGGIISSSNLVPRQWKRVLDLAMNGQLKEAVALHATMRPLIDAIFSEPNPAPIKAALELQGLAFGDVLPPLKSVSETLRRRLAELLPAFIARETN